MSAKPYGLTWLDTFRLLRTPFSPNATHIILTGSEVSSWFTVKRDATWTL